MKLAKSLLLASATAFVAVAGANAADLPSKKAAPATYVKVCDAYGAGFYTIPGTDTCIKVGGRVRVDYAASGKKDVSTATTAVSTAGASENLWGNEVRGRLDMDARTPTAYGTVQAVFSTRLHRTAGVLDSSSLTSAVGTSSVSQLEGAYVRFAGFTFGVAKDNFSFMPSTFYGAGHWSSFANGAFQAAYTAVLGGGFSATLAVQDQSYTTSGAASGTAWQTALQNAYDKMPQINGRVDFDQAWGTASVMGAVTQAHMTTSATAQTYDKSKTVWAVGAGVKLNLPMLAAGDALYLNGGYADGMTEYTVNWISFKSSDTKRNVGGYVQTAYSFGPGANGIETFKSWNVAALMTHFWAPQWRHSFLASYGAVNAPVTANNAAWGTTAGGSADATVWNVGSQLAFVPTKDFEIGVEALYARVKFSNSVTTAVNTSAGNWTGRLRVERTF
jgi:hypothetical protein